MITRKLEVTVTFDPEDTRGLVWADSLRDWVRDEIDSAQWAVKRELVHDVTFQSTDIQP